MSNRVTQKDLEILVSDLNDGLGFNAVNCKTQYIVGCYQLDYAYGGVKLVKIQSTGGGQTTVSNSGYGTKKELYNFLRGMAY